MVSRKSSSRSDGEVFQKASTYTLGAFFMLNDGAEMVYRSTAIENLTALVRLPGS